MDRNTLRAALNDRTVAAMAPAMPMKLIEPLAQSADFHGDAGPTTWGVSAVGAHTSPFTGAGVTVAVLDTGIDAKHPAFTGVDLVERDFTGGGSTNDTNGHGTHCAGTIFGRDLNGLRIGVATGVTKALIGKVIGGPAGGGSDILSEAIVWAADNGANVVSMSLGIDFPGWSIGWFAKMASPFKWPPRLRSSSTGLTSGCSSTCQVILPRGRPCHTPSSSPPLRATKAVETQHRRSQSMSHRLPPRPESSPSVQSGRDRTDYASRPSRTRAQPLPHRAWISLAPKSAAAPPP